MRYTSQNSLHVDGETKSLVGRAVIIGIGSDPAKPFLRVARDPLAASKNRWVYLTSRAKVLVLLAK
jgi:hypothetical protein